MVGSAMVLEADASAAGRESFGDANISIHHVLTVDQYYIMTDLSESF